eukprot:5567881-Alexandrium_andersonii.AAC.1
MSCLLRPAVNASARSLTMKYPTLARRCAGTSFVRVHDTPKRRKENRVNCQHVRETLKQGKAKRRS